MAKEDNRVVPCRWQEVIGMITDREIVVRLVAEGKDPSSTSVKDAISKNVRSVKEDTPVNEALQVMTRNRSAASGGEQENELVGIVSMRHRQGRQGERNSRQDGVEDQRSAPTTSG